MNNATSLINYTFAPFLNLHGGVTSKDAVPFFEV